MEYFNLFLALVLIHSIHLSISEMVIQEMNASKDGKNLTVLAVDPINSLTIVS